MDELIQKIKDHTAPLLELSRDEWTQYQLINDIIREACQQVLIEIEMEEND